MTINMQRDGPVHFVIGSDDGSQLYVDGELWIDNWGSHSYREMGVTSNQIVDWAVRLCLAVEGAVTHIEKWVLQGTFQKERTH